MVRLDRFLADGSTYSRSDVKKLIRAGRISVNGSTAVKPDMKVDPDKDCVLADGVQIRQTGRICLMMNKSAGVVSATQDTRDRTVIDLIREPYADRLFPVGRLDKDTEGLLLLTNDGMLSHNLLSPARHVSKTYFVIITGAPDEQLIDRFRTGMDIGDKKPTKPSMLLFLTVDGDFLEEHVTRPSDGEDDTKQLPPGMVSLEQMKEFCMRSIALADYARCGEDECCAAVSVTEGRFHQIKRMFDACGRKVRFLKRIAMGSVMLDPDLEPGSYRELTSEEWKLLEG